MRALQSGDYLIDAERFLLFCFVCKYNMKLLKLVKLLDLYTRLFLQHLFFMLLPVDHKL